MVAQWLHLSILLQFGVHAAKTYKRSCSRPFISAGRANTAALSVASNVGPYVLECKVPLQRTEANLLQLILARLKTY